MTLNPLQSQGGSWHENSLLVGEPQREKGSRWERARMWGLGPYSLQELEQMGRCRTEPAEGSELPTVSGAGAEPEAARLASVSRAASSQEPEPGPGERKPNPKGEIPDQGPPPPPRVASALLTCSPRHLFPPHRVPHHHWPRAPAPPRHSGAVDLFSPPQTAGLLQPQWGRQRSVWRRLKGRTEE